MPKAITPLTDSQCKNLALPAKGINQLSDGHGLSLQADSKGGKYWRLRYYHPHTKKREEIRLGIYPDVSLKAARVKREEMRALLGKGIDPKQHQQEQEIKQRNQALNSFEAVARKWHTDQQAKPDKWTPEHAHRLLRSIELHIFPDIGQRPIAEIMPLEVLSLLQRLEAAGKYDTAHKVYDVVNQVFSYAVRLQICVFNPAAELRRELAQVKQQNFHHLSDPAEIGQLLRDIDGYTGTPQVRILLKLSPYVFTRPAELRMMKWEELDWDNGIWEKSGEGEQKGERMKNGLDFLIPLSRQAAALIEQMKPITGHYDYVFWNKSTGQPFSEAAASKALHRLGYKDKQTMHGFRHIASTALNEQGFNGDWVERQLAHKDPNQTRKTYNKAEYLEQRTAMMQAYADYLDSLKDGNK